MYSVLSNYALRRYSEIRYALCNLNQWAFPIRQLLWSKTLKFRHCPKTFYSKIEQWKLLDSRTYRYESVKNQTLRNRRYPSRDRSYIYQIKTITIPFYFFSQINLRLFLFYASDRSRFECIFLVTEESRMHCSPTMVGRTASWRFSSTPIAAFWVRRLFLLFQNRRIEVVFGFQPI